MGYSSISYARAYMSNYFLCLLTGLLGSIVIIGISHFHVFDKFGEIVGTRTLHILCAHLIIINRFRDISNILNTVVKNETLHTIIFVIINIVLALLLVFLFEFLTHTFTSKSSERIKLGIDNQIIWIVIFISCLLLMLITNGKDASQIVKCICISTILIICGVFYRKQIPTKSIIVLTSIMILYDVINAICFGLNSRYILTIFIVSVILISYLIDKLIEDLKCKSILIIGISIIGYSLYKFNLGIECVNLILYFTLIFYIGYVAEMKMMFKKVVSYHFSYFIISTILAYEVYVLYTNMQAGIALSYSCLVLTSISNSLLFYYLLSYLCLKLNLV